MKTVSPSASNAFSAREGILGRDALTELAFRAAHGNIGGIFHQRPCLLVDLNDSTAIGTLAVGRLTHWLQNQACPVIGIGSSDNMLAPGCDLVVDDEASAASVIANIEQAPVAATCLVQVLRLTASMPLNAALVAESLAYATLQGGAEFARWSAQHPPHPETIASDPGPAVLVERDQNCLYLRLNRPSSRNGMTVEMRDALVEALELAIIDDSITQLRLSGAGACFSTGGALEEFGTAGDPATAHLVRCSRLPAAALLRVTAHSHVHLHGACIGSGIEFPAFAAHITASADTFFQLPEIRFGLIPGAGGCISIARRIGRQRTAYLALSARRIKAETALQWGLIDAIEDKPSWAA